MAQSVALCPNDSNYSSIHVYSVDDVTVESQAGRCVCVHGYRPKTKYFTKQIKERLKGTTNLIKR